MLKRCDGHTQQPGACRGTPYIHAGRGKGGGGAAEGASNALALADSIAVATNESLALAGQALARVAMRAAWELRQARENRCGRCLHAPLLLDAAPA